MSTSAAIQIEQGPSTAIVEFNQFESDLAEYTQRYKDVVYDLTVPDQEKQARSDRLAIGKKVAELDRVHAAVKAPLKAQTDLLDGERKRIKDGLLLIQDGIKSQIAEHDAAIQAKEDELAARVEAIKNLAIFEFTPFSAAVRVRLGELSKIAIDATFEHHEANAALAHRKALETLEAVLAATIKAEADAAELARLQAEAAAREQKEREDRIAAEAAEKARLEAEAKAERERLEREEAARIAAESAEKARLEEQQKAERDRIAKEEADRMVRETAERARKQAEEAAELANQRAEQAERDRVAAAEQAEKDRLESEQRAKDAAAKAEKDAQEAAERAKHEAAEAARLATEKAEQAQRDKEEREQKELAAREADQKHREEIDGMACAVLIDLCNLSPSAAKAIITAISADLVPNVKIHY